MKKILNLILALLILSCANAQDIPLADFEQSTYKWLPTNELWTSTGTCFGGGPAQGTLTNQQTVAGYLEKGLVNTYLGGDNSIGTLTSPNFTITRKYIRFLIGGGNWRPQTSINLMVNGEVVRTSVGMGDRETLGWLQWNVSDFLNESAKIQIVDSTTAGWGHLNVDQIIATDASLSSVIVADKNYLLLPVKTGVTKQLVELVQNGLVVREMKVELSSTPDFWAFMDLTPFKGQELVVRLNSKLASLTELQNFFVQSDSITTATPIYQETLRPIYHYTAKRGFLSDPNNLVYKDGEYHMSYQHNPYGCAWDNMHHGHAVSTDLVHWKELPEALYPTYWGTAWNGSSVVDWNNTAGFGSKSIVTLYTSVGGWSDNSRMSLPNRFAQSLAYSTDNGRTFKYYKGNPVIPNFYNSEHDPVVFWYAPGQVWVMTLFVGDNDGYRIFNSTDLKNWVFTSSVNIPGATEVSDLFPLALDGDPTKVKWVFSAGYRQYIVGTFDGKTFTQEYGPFWFASQQWDLSAALTFNNTPDGRRIMLSNGRTEYPGMPFNRYMNLPNVLTLKKNSAGEPRVYVNPVEEISKLRTDTLIWNSQTLKTGVNLMSGLSGEGVELEIVFKAQNTSAQMDFSVGEFVLSYNFAQGGKIGAGGQWRSLQPMADGNVHIRAFYDRGIWEVFANGGEFYYPAVLTPKAGNWPLSLTTKNASIDIVSLSLHRLGRAIPDSTAQFFEVTGVTLDKSTLSMVEGSTEQLTATILPANASNTTLLWQSSNTDVAIVNASGKVTAISSGTATITVTSQSGSKTAEISVAVTPRPVVVNPEELKEVIISNIITPNNDGKNDQWIIKNIADHPNNSVKVFDGSGRLVFSKTGYSNDWAATFNGDYLIDGSYLFLVDLGNGKKAIKGYLSVLKNKQ